MTDPNTKNTAGRSDHQSNQREALRRFPLFRDDQRTLWAYEGIGPYKSAVLGPVPTPARYLL